MNKILIANWKMNNTYNDSIKFLYKLYKYKNFLNNVLCIIAAPYIYLNILNKICKYLNINIFLSSQNVHYKDFGSYTGEISSVMLKSIGINYVIIGHIERRIKFYENDDIIIKKIYYALKHNLKIILCINNSSNYNDNFLYVRYIINNYILKIFSIKNISDLIIVYEPMENVNSNIKINVNCISNVINYIKNILHDRYGNLSDNIPILYGGNVNKDNIDKLSIININGYILGRSSILFNDFLYILKYINMK